MVLEPVPTPPATPDLVRCIECDTPADTAAGWKAYIGGGLNGDPVEVLIYCPDCAAREFGTSVYP